MELPTTASPEVQPDDISRLVAAMRVVWQNGMPGTRSLHVTFGAIKPNMPAEITGERHPIPRQPDIAA